MMLGFKYVHFEVTLGHTVAYTPYAKVKKSLN